HAVHELAGQRPGTQEGHEQPAVAAGFRVCGNARLATGTHLLDDAENALLGGWRYAVAHLGALRGKQLIQGLYLGRPVEDDRPAVGAVEVIEHLPVAQVAGDAHYALA